MRRAAAALLALWASTALAIPSGNKWLVFPSYKVFDHSTTNGISGITNFSSAGGVLERVRVAFQNWTPVGGVTCTSWTSTYGGLIGGSPSTSLINGNDNNNYVVWLGGPDGSSWRYGSATLGLTTTTYLTTSREIVDADMEMNNTSFSGSTRWAANGDFNRFDYESVVLHEAGHFLGLDHTTNDGTAVMYPTVSPGELKRALATADVNDVCGIYPGQAGSQGSPCSSNSQCTGGRVCRAPSGSTSKICTVDCTSGAACPTGTTCQNADVGKGCFLPVGSPDLCKFCTSGADCPSGRCVTDGVGHNYCTITCQSAGACGAGYNCQTTSIGALCVPTGNCTNQCTTATNCAPGYTCTGGTCEPTGNPGDRCDISLYCKNCGICIGSQTSAYCRACCGGGSGSGECQGCTPASCGSSASCSAVSGSTDQVCVPTSSAALCQACSTSVPCGSGMNCIAGRCHNACNPTSPGACTACLDQGGGSGVCACSDEVAQVGQPCGPQSGGGFFACVNTLKCVGSPQKACARPCTPGTTTGCQTGEVCSQVDGVYVCVNGGPGQRCGACQGGSCNSGLSCSSGTCYETCNAQSTNRCASCVALQPNGDGVCACNIAVANQACPTSPTPTACQNGLQCVNGYCRTECNVTAPGSCPLGLECRVLAGVGLPYCQDPAGAGGGSGAGGGTGGGTGGFGGGATGGGAGGGTISNEGCGCAAGSGGLALWALGSVLALGLRRRRG